MAPSGPSPRPKVLSGSIVGAPQLPTPATVTVPLDSSLTSTLFGPHIATATVPTNLSYCPILPLSQSGTGVSGVARQDTAGAVGTTYLQSPGDFDTGLGIFPDGPFAGKQDEGNCIYSYFDTTQNKIIYPVAYSNWNYEPPGDLYYSPNRQMPSPGLFGSLLSHPADAINGGTTPAREWETLAFCPNTCGQNHPGNTVLPRDHLLLDLFNMPFVEPYLISEPLSTAGRV